MPKILMIAYHYPPIAGSSGVQRTLSFANYLAEAGWTPIVLSVHQRAYSALDEAQLARVDPRVKVVRAQAFDTSRHLAIKGRYLKLMALPDNYISWLPGALWVGSQIIRREQPEFIWSTYPTASAMLVGLGLKKISGLPWVADFRDSMSEPGYPSDPWTYRVVTWIERKTIRHCDRAVFTAPGAVRMYAERYPHAADKLTIIENGYDEEAFTQDSAAPTPKVGTEPFTFLHSGLMYPKERDPTALMQALAALKHEGVGPDQIRVRFRASGHDDFLDQLAKREGVRDYIDLAPRVPYAEALAEMLTADCLTIVQARSCNHQIPAKVYEYLRACRPILSLTAPEGYTAGTTRGRAHCTVADLEDAASINAALLKVSREQSDPEALCAPARYADCSRLSRTNEFLELLAELNRDSAE